MPRLGVRILSLFAAFLLLAAAPVQAGNIPINTAGGAYALKGYDPVAYFTEGEPREGSPEFSHEWMGVTWLFTSAEHRDSFAADPEAYAPQFGGYCAYALAKGNKAPANPKVWSIHDGKLYLNLSPSVQEKWEAKRPALIVTAREKWQEMSR